MDVLVDTGAGGGNHASATFIYEIERTEYDGRSMISKKGKGRLRAARNRQCSFWGLVFSTSSSRR